MSRSPSPQKPVGRLVVGAVLTALVLVAGCGDESDATSATSSSADLRATPSLAASAAFEKRIATPGVLTINVHVPNEGSIAGTDLTIPFDQISTSEGLPADLATPLAVYCRSGNMSATAVRDLAALGYTDVVELEGGFNAWKASGRPLETP